MEDISKTLLDLIPSQFALENKVFPVQLDQNNLQVAMTNTNNFQLVKDLMLITRKNIVPVKMDEDEILKAIAKYYQISISLESKRDQVKEFTMVKKIINLAKEGEDFRDDQSVVLGINKIITNAINQGISDIHFEPFEKIFKVRYRKDGNLQEVENLQLDKRAAYTSRLKIMADLDIAEKRRPQDGRIRMSGGKKVVDIRVSTMPTDFGEKVVLRLLDKTAFKLDLDNIGFNDEMKIVFQNALQSPYGIILVTGPTGSGKTTTLYTALNYLNKPDINILTIEDPIEYNLDGINQAHVRADIGFTFANALRSFLRQDPDIIMVGEIRDSDTAEIAIRAALTGHLVLSTLHTNDAPTAIARLVDMGVEPFLVISSLRLVMAQRLVRKTCTHCKESYEPNASLRKRFSIDAEKVEFYKGKGCDYCNQSGYSGRTAIIEMLPISEKIAELILNQSNSIDIRKQAQAEGMLSLNQHALQKVKTGITTLEEIAKQLLL